LKDGCKEKTVAISDALDEYVDRAEYFASNYDPHIWFDVDYWSTMTTYVTENYHQILKIDYYATNRIAII
jgi:manganese/zinc/iron transport system substrate-binding protein